MVTGHPRAAGLVVVAQGCRVDVSIGGGDRDQLSEAAAEELPGAAAVPRSCAELEGVRSRESEALEKACNKAAGTTAETFGNFTCLLSLVLGVVLCVLCIEDGPCCAWCDSAGGRAVCALD